MDKKPKLGKEIVNDESYRVSNARKVNASKYPDGYIYILKLDGFDLYKVGVSRNPNRRIKDIRSALPFTSSLMYCSFYYNVYLIEELVHDLFKENKHRKEWYKCYEECISNLITDLKELTGRQKAIINECLK